MLTLYLDGKKMVTIRAKEVERDLWCAKGPRGTLCAQTREEALMKSFLAYLNSIKAFRQASDILNKR